MISERAKKVQEQLHIVRKVRFGWFSPPVVLGFVMSKRNRTPCRLWRLVQGGEITRLTFKEALEWLQMHP